MHIDKVQVAAPKFHRKAALLLLSCCNICLIAFNKVAVLLVLIEYCIPSFLFKIFTIYDYTDS